MKACSLVKCYEKRQMVKRREIDKLAGFLDRCNTACHLNPSSSYRAETNRRMRHAYASWYMTKCCS